MSGPDADKFLDLAHRRLDYMRSHASIEIDGVGWTIGFVEGAPFASPTKAFQVV